MSTLNIIHWFPNILDEGLTFISPPSCNQFLDNIVTSQLFKIKSMFSFGLFNFLLIKKSWN